LDGGVMTPRSQYGSHLDDRALTDMVPEVGGTDQQLDDVPAEPGPDADVPDADFLEQHRDVPTDDDEYR
jgi:hypothetical protein